MYRTSVYRRQARAKAIRRKKFYAHATVWIYTHPDGALSKGKIHCSCPMCAAKSSRDGGVTSNSYVIKSKQGKLAIIFAREQLADIA